VVVDSRGSSSKPGKDETDERDILSETDESLCFSVLETKERLGAQTRVMWGRMSQVQVNSSIIIFNRVKKNVGVMRKRVYLLACFIFQTTELISIKFVMRVLY
jgi:hypothetical protein